MQAPYALHWLSCADDPALAERFFVPDFRGSLPFLLEGDAPAAGAAAGALDEEQLLKGLLTGLAEHDHAGRPALRTLDQPVLLQLVEVMRQGYSFDDLEELVIETSGNLRARHGVRPSCAALTTGVLLAPAAVRLKADLLIDLWTVAHEAGDPDQAGPLLRQVPDLFDALDPARVPEPTMEACAFLALATHHVLGRFTEEGAMEEFLVTHVVERVHHPLLKAKVQELVQAEQEGRRLTQADLHVA